MNPHDIFSLSNTTALAMWLLLILLPKWKVTLLLRKYKFIPLIFSVLYVIYIGMMLSQQGMMDFGSLNSVMELFTIEELVLAGWLHYLAFDLLIGMWILDDNESHGIHHLIIIPCLLCTFMFGPMGFLIYTIIKTIKKQRS